MRSRSETWAAVVADYEARPDGAQPCALGDQLIVHPDGSELQAPAFYILGFNGGETTDHSPLHPNRPTRSARRWFELCERAAQAVGVSSWGITERCHWGSPDVPTLIQRVGSRAAVRQLLKLHAVANLALFRETPPLVVWVTGLGWLAEAVEDYGLTAVGEPEQRQAPLKGILWRHFVADDGTPYLFSRHPTGARFAKGEHERLFEKLGQLASGRMTV